MTFNFDPNVVDQMRVQEEPFYHYDSSDAESDDEEYVSRTVSLKDYHSASGIDRGDVIGENTAIFTLKTNTSTVNYKKRSSGMLVRYQETSTPTTPDASALHTPMSMWKQ